MLSSKIYLLNQSNQPINQTTMQNESTNAIHIASVLSNITILADKVGRTYDHKYLASCEESELRDLQDNLIEDYNRKLND